MSRKREQLLREALIARDEDAQGDVEQLAEAGKTIAALEEELIKTRILATALAVNWRGSDKDLDMIWKLGVDAGKNEETRAQWHKQLQVAGMQGLLSWFVEWGGGQG